MNWLKGISYLCAIIGLAVIILDVVCEFDYSVVKMFGFIAAAGAFVFFVLCGNSNGDK